MAYEKFTVNEIFSDQRVNTYCDALISYVVDELQFAEQNLAFSGGASLALQGDKTATARAIIFATTEQGILDALATGFAKRFKSASVMRFKDHVFIDMGTFKFEVWKLDSVAVITAFNVICHEDIDIPQNLK